MEARSCKFRTYSYKFRKGMSTGAQRSNLPPNFPKWKIISAKTVLNLPKLRESCAPWQKLRGCAKTRKLRKSCAPQHRNFLVGLRITLLLLVLLYFRIPHCLLNANDDRGMAKHKTGRSGPSSALRAATVWHIINPGLTDFSPFTQHLSQCYRPNSVKHY